MATETRRRKAFGPLFYGTLALALIVAGGVEVWTNSLWKHVRAHPETPVRPDDEAEGLATLLSNPKAVAHERAVAAQRLGGVLLQAVSSDEHTGPRSLALQALRQALRDEDREVATAAARSLGALRHHGRSAADDLADLLDTEDEVLRLAAAEALIRIGVDPGPAISALAKLLTEPALIAPRREVLAALLSAGAQGEPVVFDSLARMLDDPDEDIRLEAADLLSALGPIAARMHEKIDSLLDSPDRRVRFSTALAALGAASPTPNTDPRIIGALEATAADPSARYALRERALKHLNDLSPPALRRAGLSLARQLDVDAPDARLAAATLLQTIAPDVLAAKAGPASGR